jgi:hypothetical protein
MFEDQVDLNGNVSLADLVNGSCELEKRLRGECKLIDTEPNATRTLPQFSHALSGREHVPTETVAGR